MEFTNKQLTRQNEVDGNQNGNQKHQVLWSENRNKSTGNHRKSQKGGIRRLGGFPSTGKHEQKYRSDKVHGRKEGAGLGWGGAMT